MKKLLAFRHNIILHLLILIQSAFCGLYSADDKVILLDNSTFVQTITGKPYGWVMEFFASWCGHCHNFAPYYKQFAEEIRYWSQLKVGAIDCADFRNEDICMHYEVTGYPTVRYFPPNTTNSELGVQRDSWDQRVSSLKSDSIYYLESVQNLFDCFPDLEPMQDYTDDFQWEADQELFFIVEDEYSFVGKEVILNVNSLCGNSETYISRLLLNQNSSSLNVSMTPALLYWNGSHAQFTNFLVTADEVNDILRYHFSGTTDDDLFSHNFQLDPVIELQPYEVSESEIKRRRFNVYLVDLEKTVVLALTNEIQNQIDDLSDEKLAALEEFLQVLGHFFPPSSILHDILKKISTKDLIQGDSSENPLFKLGNSYETSSWIGCRGSSKVFGGYSCGQWMLWHTLTVQQYLQNRGDPRAVLDAMNSYIKHFFGCRTCSAHFVNMTQDGQAFQYVQSYEDSVLYLWEAHNEVNLRLANTTSEDPMFPKFQFPGADQCQHCYQSQEGEYNSTEMAKFLVDMYSDIDTTTTTSTSIPVTTRLLHTTLLVVSLVLLFF